ncbi:MAG: type 1 glutamine amidotransferase [Bacteriovorax sp.]|nr:type 1 glutamine amidotransferase [Bacteriovorax sp.]
MTDQKSTLLLDRRIAILATDGFEESELFEPKKALEDAGAKVDIISLQPGRIKAWKDDDWGKSIHVDATVDDTEGYKYDSLLIPGGVLNPDKLRSNKRAIAFILEFVEDDKTIASICHGPQVLIEAGLTKGKHLTSWPSLKTDLINSGADWVDEEVVVDEHLITSRSPRDIPAFNKKIIEEFAHSTRRI